MIKIESDCLHEKEAKNLQLIIQQSFLSNIKDNLVVKFFNDQILIENQSQNSHYTIEVNHPYQFDDTDIFNKIFTKKNSRILDCTGGLCKDTLKLEKLGHSITVIEENPIIIAMVRTFLNRNKHLKITLLYGNSFDYLKYCDYCYDYIYIDTMFDNKKNTAKPKKDMEILRLICKEKILKNNLIKLSLNKCTQAVVSKDRRRNMIGLKPNYRIKTKLVSYSIFK